MRQYLHCDKGYSELEVWEPDCWINVECPDGDDFEFLTMELGIPEAFLMYVADVDERPRVESEGDWTLTVLRLPVETRSGAVPYSTVPMGVITGKGVTVTVCYHRTDVIPDFIAHTRRKGIDVPSHPDFILRLLYSAVYWFLRYLKEINNDVTTSERSLERSVTNADLLRMMRLEKSLVFFNTSLRGNEMLTIRLRRVFGDSYDMDLFEDVEIEMKQAMNTVNVYSNILTASMDAFASVISNNVNLVMKRMTGVTIVLMIPTLIASFYGMNVKIGLSDSPYAFAFIVGMAVVLTIVTILLLRRVRWF